MERELTCIVCPMGCSIKVITDGENVISITGNTCKRGEQYARSECTAPKRTVTSTVRGDNGEMISVKTSTAIPKEKVFDCMKVINGIVAKTPVKIGQVLAEDIFGSNIVATMDSRADAIKSRTDAIKSRADVIEAERM